MDNTPKLPTGPIAIWVANAEGTMIESNTFSGQQTAIFDNGKNTTIRGNTFDIAKTPLEEVFEVVAGMTVQELPVKMRWVGAPSLSLAKKLAAYFTMHGFNVTEFEKAGKIWPPLHSTIQCQGGILYVDVSK
ncbi:hypothetical protein WG907_05095 [Sphingobium sp. AN558]|uniref:hypothetical protein n=1 Tax=Sphingobium sp. AN558 TaxID=3133442 RepID=UPI0030C54756